MSQLIEEEVGDKSVIASALHQMGNIHQVKGEYEKALEKYNRSLTISEEIGDKLCIALTLAQVGRVKYGQKRYQEAISALSRAASIFEELESPYLEQAIKDLDSIKEEIGEEKFNEVIQESNENK